MVKTTKRKLRNATMRAICALFRHEMLWSKPGHTGAQIGLCITCDKQFFRSSTKKVIEMQSHELS